MDHLALTVPATAATMSPSQGRRVIDAYKKVVETAAMAATFVVVARSIPRELLPSEVRDAVRWCAAAVRARLGWGEKKRNTFVIRRQCESTAYGDNHIFQAARRYLDATIDPCAMRRLSLASSHTNEPDGTISSSGTLLCMEPGCSTTDVFDGVVFTWTSVATGAEEGKTSKGNGGGLHESLELSFDAEHTDTALEQYMPFVMSTVRELQLKDRALRIFMNEGRSWHGINHHHPATFDTIAMDPAQKQSIIADLDRFLGRRDYYRRIGKAWKRGYLLYGPPGTGKSSLVAAMANYLRFNLYDLDLSAVYSNSSLQRLLTSMPNKTILVIEDIDCCFDAAASREPEPDDGLDHEYLAGYDNEPPAQRGAPPVPKGITLSGLLNFIDGLWSTCGEQRIIVLTTNYKDRLDPALLRPGRMDMHVYMGYCGWEAFKTLAKNYFLVDDHTMFPEIQELLSTVEVTPAEVTEMLLRSEDADVALKGLVKLVQDKKKQQ